MGRWISKSAFTVYSQRHTNLHLVIIIVNTLSKDKAIIKNLFENNNSSCLEKGTIFNEITTVVTELRIQKRQHIKKMYIITYAKKGQFCYQKLFLTTMLLNLFQMGISSQEHMHLTGTKVY